ncbi:MAG: hypothetical protein KJ676_08855 [Alphaproteobacteria bacterium]|nr:hypothetical protein [Alphaproteobacteria bacterium]MBU1525456.1 hypothetical protein [Alphaproteobacteria bacterium]MBU2116718.1 hypothetical protein [Alphaproteobacteria bacterium]MBU2350858.1 hypothetical protein [Alphaproteobacteria bacterium]MBU2381761.1 hypothetical protein [Alphaproteobacteria bacterium]
MNKLLIGGAAGVLLIAGQAIAARLPEAIAAPATDPVVAEAVTADPVVRPTVRAAATPLVIRDADLASPLPTFVADRLDPGTTPDPVAASGGTLVAGGLTEAETARLAVRRGEGIWSGDCISRGTCLPVLLGAAVVVTAIVVATDDDSDSN